MRSVVVHTSCRQWHNAHEWTKWTTLTHKGFQHSAFLSQMASWSLARKHQNKSRDFSGSFDGYKSRAVTRFNSFLCFAISQRRTLGLRTGNWEFEFCNLLEWGLHAAETDFSPESAKNAADATPRDALIVLQESNGAEIPSRIFRESALTLKSNAGSRLSSSRDSLITEFTAESAFI